MKTDRFEKIMWFGLAKTLLFLLAGSVLTFVYKNFIFLIFGSGIALVIWRYYSIYCENYMKENPNHIEEK